MTEAFSAENMLNDLIAGGLTPDEISFLTRAQYGGRLEMDKQHNEGGEQWGAVNTLQSHLIETNPQRTFDLGIALITTEVPIEKQQDHDAQKIRLWNLGTGIGLLSDPRLTTQLKEYLTSENALTLLRSVKRVLDTHLTIPDDINGLSDYPECYAVAASVLFAIQLEDSKNDAITQLKHLAQAKLHDPEFKRLLDLYNSIPDTKEFAQAIKSFFS